VSDDEPRSPFADQLFSIAVASLLVLGVIWVSYKWGYHTQKAKHVKEEQVALSMPASVYIPLVVVVLAGTIASFWAEMREKLADTFRDASQSSKTERRFKPLPEWLLQLLVYVLTIVVVFALIRLVSQTGGFTRSPFNPLMTAPAVVGAFMAFSKKTTIQLMVVGIASVWLSIEVLSFSSPHVVDPGLLKGVTRGQLHDPIPLVASSWVYGLIATAMLILAGGLSYFRHTRKPVKRSEHATLSDIVKRRLESLFGDAV
jgi:branched-subunit amino acid transport protein